MKFLFYGEKAKEETSVDKIINANKKIQRLKIKYEDERCFYQSTNYALIFEANKKLKQKIREIVIRLKNSLKGLNKSDLQSFKKISLIIKEKDLQSLDEDFLEIIKEETLRLEDKYKRRILNIEINSQAKAGKKYTHISGKNISICVNNSKLNKEIEESREELNKFRSDCIKSTTEELLEMLKGNLDDNHRAIIRFSLKNR